jgi:branched-chain amino acid transport system permease protein
MYRPVLDQPRSVPLLISVGALIAITELLRLPRFFGPSVHPLELTGLLPGMQIGGFRLTSIQLTIIVVSAVCVTAVWLVVRMTSLGLSWRAITEDRQVAGSFGINVDRSVAINFLLGSALAGVAAVLAGGYTNAVSASMGDVIAYKAFVIVVLGGLGSVGGAVAASLVLALAEILSARYLGGILPRDVIAFIVLIAVLLIRPQGLARTGRS